jgi:hypothetical protein
LQVEQLERRVLTDRQALIGRVEPAQLPSFPVEQAALDAWLISEPTHVAALSVEEVEQLEERRALGVA